MSTGIQISPSSDITVGTTPISGGTDGRVLFEDGGVVQQDADLHWDNTNKRLGLGTPTPSEKLEVAGNVFLENGTTTTFTLKSTSALNARTSFQQTSNKFWILPDSGVTEIVINEVGRNCDLRVEGDNDANLLFADASTDRVGIGTSTPSEILHISQDDPSIRIDDTSAASRSQINSGLEIYDNTGTLSSYFRQQNSADLEIRTTAGNVNIGNFTNTHLLNLVASNVGIGTSTPSEKLEVAGNIKISGDMLKMSGITTTERNALTAEAGDIIYNTTTNKHQGYDGTSWNNLY